MKKVTIILILIISTILSFSSCSSDDKVEPEIAIKKLITENITDNHGNFKRTFSYNADNNVTEINTIYTGDDQFIADLIRTVFSYENNRITSAITYEDGELYLNHVFNYANNQLTEQIHYTSNGEEDEKIEFYYNSNGELNQFKYYVEQELQQTMNYIYNSNGNIITAEDGVDTYEIQFDQNKTPYENFTSQNKILFSYVSLIENLSNNNIVEEIITYNNNLPNKEVYTFETTILYDSDDDYPTSKTTIKTFNNIQSTQRVITYTYN